jgi:3-oxoacyl-(acyl-carrier-protein) synthase
MSSELPASSAAGVAPSAWRCGCQGAGRLPSTANVDAVDPAFAIELVRGETRPADGLRAVMSNSFAFGGTGVALVATRAD